MDAAAAKLLGAGIAMLGLIGAGIGIGSIGNGALQAIGRNPDAAPAIQQNMISAIAFAEAIGIYALATALILVFAA